MLCRWNRNGCLDIRRRYKLKLRFWICSSRRIFNRFRTWFEQSTDENASKFQRLLFVCNHWFKYRPKLRRKMRLRVFPVSRSLLRKRYRQTPWYWINNDRHFMHELESCHDLIDNYTRRYNLQTKVWKQSWWVCIKCNCCSS